MLKCGEDCTEALNGQELVVHFGRRAVGLDCCSQGTKAVNDAFLRCQGRQSESVVSEDDSVRHHHRLGVEAEECVALIVVHCWTNVEPFNSTEVT